MLKKSFFFLGLIVFSVFFISCPDSPPPPSKDIAVESISFEISTDVLCIGEGFTLSPKFIPENATNKRLDWTSSAESVVTVGKDGGVKARGLGEATIIARTKDGGFEATCDISVVIIKSVYLNKSSLSLAVSKSETLIPRSTVSNGYEVIYTWTSSDEDIATVDENGRVTAKKSGIAGITVTTDPGNLSATCTLTVGDTPIKHFMITPTDLKLSLNNSSQLYPVFTPSDASNKTVFWESEDETIATVDQNGLVTGIKAGFTYIKATTEVGNLSAYCQIQVLFKPVISVDISPTFPDLFAGQTCQLSAKFTPEDASNKKVSWSSNNDSVATVDENGLVTAHTAGDAKITVTTDDGNKTNTTTVRVFNNSLAVGILLPPNDSYLNVTETEGSVRLAMGLGEVLEENLWTPANTSDYGQYIFYFFAESGQTYYVEWDDKKDGSSHNNKKNYTGDVEVLGVVDPNTNYFVKQFTNTDNGYDRGSYKQSFTANSSSYIFIPIVPYDNGIENNGSFAIRISRASSPEPRTKFSWYLDGVKIPDADDYEYVLNTAELNSGKHRVTVIASRDDVVESAEYVYIKE